MTEVSAKGPRTYGNWRRPASAGLLGLGSVGTAVLLGGLIVVVLTVMVGGIGPGVVAALVLVALLGLLLIKNAHGQSVLTRAGARIGGTAPQIHHDPLILNDTDRGADLLAVVEPAGAWKLMSCSTGTPST